jgi:hypothetical protein
MYKCPKCGRQVCHACFDTSRRQCAECARPARETELRDKEVAERLADEKQRAEDRRRQWQNAVTGLLTALGFVAAAGVVAYLLLNGIIRVPIPGVSPARRPAPPAMLDTIR